MMQRVEIRPDQDVFLDLGSGMGRAVLLAATYPFRKVIGVEITPQLNASAQKNCALIRSRLRCRDIEFHVADAREFQIAGDITVIYLWNPFFESVLAPVFENIRASLRETPRAITILYVSPPGTPHLANLKSQLTWLTEKERVPWGDDELVVYSCGRKDASMITIGSPAESARTRR
jgi:SAM-dependent methyltransferase